jgi:hypothetical protein
VNRSFLLLTVMGLLLLGSPMAQAADYGFGVKVGTLGLGAEVTTHLTDKVSARFGANWFSFETEGTEDQIDYNVDLNLGSFAALLDWHPMAGRFHLTGGVLVNNNELKLKTSGQDDYEIGNETYTGELHVKGVMNFRRTAPYVGLGWGMAPVKTGHWALAIELGLLYQGEPRVDLTAEGTATRQSDGLVIDVTNDPDFQENLVQEQKNLQDDLKDFKFYPVASIGIMYKL